MSHRAGRPRLVLAAVAAVVGTLALPSRSPLAAQSSSQDTTGRGAGWGIDFHAVMHFGDLDVEIRTKRTGGFFNQSRQ